MIDAVQSPENQAAQPQVARDQLYGVSVASGADRAQTAATPPATLAALTGTFRRLATALLATTAAWAVFGAARRWFQTTNRVPAEEMAARIETMVGPVLFGVSQ